MMQFVVSSVAFDLSYFVAIGFVLVDSEIGSATDFGQLVFACSDWLEDT